MYGRLCLHKKWACPNLWRNLRHSVFFMFLFLLSREGLSLRQRSKDWMRFHFIKMFVKLFCFLIGETSFCDIGVNYSWLLVLLNLHSPHLFRNVLSIVFKSWWWASKRRILLLLYIWLFFWCNIECDVAAWTRRKFCFYWDTVKKITLLGAFEDTVVLYLFWFRWVVCLRQDEWVKRRIGMNSVGTRWRCLHTSRVFEWTATYISHYDVVAMGTRVEYCIMTALCYVGWLSRIVLSWAGRSIAIVRQSPWSVWFKNRIGRTYRVRPKLRMLHSVKNLRYLWWRFDVFERRRRTIKLADHFLVL